MTTDQPRELGVEIGTCPVCGTPVKQIQMPDGGVSGEPCPTCFERKTPVVAETAVEQAAENTQPAPRERGTDVAVQAAERENQ